ncbi:MAG: hypothetical protein DBX52_05580 [Clostridiales bacterium]|nr:MAG: hypothetical protein DBX52_05580 [Clostridiales bacterium]
MHIFLEQLAKEAEKQNRCLFRIAEMKDGALETLELRPAPACQDCYSIAKVFTMTAIGLLWDRGILDPGERICEILAGDCPPGMDPRWREVTVDMALRHQCGLPAGFLDIDAQDPYSFGGRDFLRYLLETPPVYPPGARSLYGDGAYYLLSRVVSKKAGRPLDDFLWETLFWPLQVREAAWSRCPLGYPMGATGLFIRTEDLAKLGAVYLQGGLYGGKRILSARWIALALARGYELSPAGPGGALGKAGMFGQMLLILPAQNRAVAWQGYDQKGGGALAEWAAGFRDSAAGGNF